MNIQIKQFEFYKNNINKYYPINDFTKEYYNYVLMFIEDLKISQIDDLFNIDSYNCFNCYGCIRCNRCIKCYNCFNCVGCKFSNYLTDCKYLISSARCENCDNCKKCYDCDTCIKCNNCNSCEKCIKIKFSSNVSYMMYN
jgi:hypothetical protein